MTIAPALALLLAASAPPARAFPDAAALARREARYAPVDLRVDLSGLPRSEREALARLIEASRLLDAIYLRQVWGGNPALLLELAQDASPLGRARLGYFVRNKGPWDELDAREPFLPGVPPRPAGAGFYPAGASREEVAAFTAALPEAERARATGFFTVLRRDPAGHITVVPYSVAYQGELAAAAELLRQAARATRSPTLRAFLEKRAAAFLDDDYLASDLAWMDLDGELEPTLGPYETYEDRWFSAKAAFEAVIAVRDDAETRKLARFSGELQDVEDHLPIAPEHRNPRLGALAPIRVVNEVFAAGDAAHGVTAAAFNLPNDERVVREKGSKRVMLRNVQQAKFGRVLLPIARRVLGPADRGRVDFDAFFTQVLVHELAHGLGPHRVAAEGAAAAPVRLALEESYPAIEEAKADVAGLFALQRFIDRGVVDRKLERTLYPTYLAGMFRSLQFGLEEAHARGTALQLTWFLERGAVVARPDGTFGVDVARAKDAVRSLTGELMTLQARGDAAAARALLRDKAVLRDDVRRALDRLKGIPVDIAPRFVTAEELTAR